VERNVQPILLLHDAGSEADRQRIARLRQRLSQLDREQKQTLLDLCLRRDQLRPRTRSSVSGGGAVLSEPAGVGTGRIRERREICSANGRGAGRTARRGGSLTSPQRQQGRD